MKMVAMPHMVKEIIKNGKERERERMERKRGEKERAFIKINL